MESPSTEYQLKLAASRITTDSNATLFCYDNRGSTAEIEVYGNASLPCDANIGSNTEIYLISNSAIQVIEIEAVIQKDNHTVDRQYSMMLI